ncbi:MAG: hypothetical protein IKD12_03130 [Paludibacteraceae bacterium]|nr:hypothetical protein [Paludibacteraceae bacterium]
MAEIIPVDYMASESRWIMISAEDNAPYTTSIVVTTKTEDEAYIKYNNTPLKNVVSGENVKRKVTDGYVTYEIPSATNITGKLTAERGGYSAYILRTGKTAEASLLNIGLPDPTPVDVQITITSPDSVCPNDPYTFTADIPEVLYLVNRPLMYQWMYKSPEYPTEWRKVSGGNVPDLQIQSFKAHHVGWYKLIVAYAGHLDDPDNRFESNELFVTFKKCEPDLCIDGNLLYRDDFGGNSPSDPRVRTTPVPGMSYQQLKTDRFGSMGQGKYLVTKMGYCNGDTAALRRQYGYLPNWGSQWMLQDDHTYMSDYSRGYFVEIDGKGDNSVFYSTTINDLCQGAQLTFSAYVINVHFYEQVQKFFRVGGYNYAYPRMKFVLKNPKTGATLAEQSTGDIQPDVTKSWNIHLLESAEWQLVGMKFTVPPGIESIQMLIYNDAEGGTGNDFALDDIEIHICVPPVTVSGPDTVCASWPVLLESQFVNDGTYLEPLQYQWYFSADSTTWTPINGAKSSTLRLPRMSASQQGWYRILVGGADESTCGAMSMPHKIVCVYDGCTLPLCEEGTLLFKEDFGGNDPNDPRVGTTPVPGMSYRQSTHGMGSGTYMVTKSGYCNGDTTGWTIPGADLSAKRSQWYIQDDHTYPNDRTRGYFLEIDGSGGAQQFYQTEISGLCEGIELTFSAYVANVFTWFQYDWYTKNRGPVVSPCLKFVLTNPQTGQKLAEQNTQEIPFDNNLPAKTDWQYSSAWHLVGMNFTVPVGVDAIRLSIYNNVTNGNGNDFALDDIEIHLCMTPDTIRTDTTICDTISQILWRDSLYQIADTLRDTLLSSCGFDSIYYILHIETEHCEMPEPPFCMGGTLLFREDFGGNRPSDPMVSRTPMPGISSIYQQDYNYSAGYLAGMHYIIAKQGHPNSDFHGWHIMDDHTYPNDITRGYFFETNSRANSYYTNYIYQKEVAGLCAGMQLSFSAYFANVVTAREFKTVPFLSYSYPKFVFVVTDARTGEQLARYNTDTIGHDWSLYNIPDSWQYSAQWHLEGIKFTIPEGVDKVTLSIIDNPTQYGNAEGDDYAVDDIELYFCNNVEYQTVDTIICDTLLPFSWRGIEWTKADTIGKIYKDMQGNDSLYFVYSLRSIHCPYPPIAISQDTTICDTLSQIKWRDKLYPVTPEIQDTAYDAYGYDSVYYTLRVAIYHCPYPPVTISSDTTICDTLSQIAWRDKIYAVASELRDTLYESYGADSIYYILNVIMEHCCPDIQTIYMDSAVCDTLMPFLWFFRDTMLLYERPGSQEVEVQHAKWEKCIGTVYTLVLDTFHCERLYPIIVNKYNWQLVCDNVALRRFFPDNKALAFQWYKNGEPIPGANEDDYAERNELNGIFQLQIRLDAPVDNDDEYIWSNILEIGEVQAPEPIVKKVYHWWSLTIIRYQQGDRVWYEKKLR